MMFCRKGPCGHAPVRVELDEAAAGRPAQLVEPPHQLDDVDEDVVFVAGVVAIVVSVMFVVVVVVVIVAVIV